ncbi:Transcription initiation factor IIE subunit alpha [Aphelenchoides fujianensis]|nr:Transcription initiation factor IIE subunit alpha [Aphelenchoides fujianensis]
MEQTAANERLIAEVPDRLKALSLILVKAFYGLQHYVLLDFIQRNVCVKEDQIRDILKIEHRLLRTLLVDKFVKERTIAEEMDGRARKVNYYHVNYKAILNVTKYKIDHMRQKIEVREQDNVRKASYVCTGCKRNYDAMDVGKIYDVLAVRREGGRRQDRRPTEETRSSLAKFNNQMAGIFSMLQEMDGVRFARNILEPPIALAGAVKTEEPADGKRALQVGERMFSTATKGRSEIYSNGITVSIGDRAEAQIEAKAAVPWLQHNAHNESAPAPAFANGTEPTAESQLTEMVIQAAAASEDTPNGRAENGTHPTDEQLSFLDRMLGVGKSADIGELLMALEGLPHTEAT